MSSWQGQDASKGGRPLISTQRLHEVRWRCESQIGGTRSTINELRDACAQEHGKDSRAYLLVDTMARKLNEVWDSLQEVHDVLGKKSSPTNSSQPGPTSSTTAIKPKKRRFNDVESHTQDASTSSSSTYTSLKRLRINEDTQPLENTNPFTAKDGMPEKDKRKEVQQETGISGAAAPSTYNPVIETEDISDEVERRLRERQERRKRRRNRETKRKRESTESNTFPASHQQGSKRSRTESVEASGMSGDESRKEGPDDASYSGAKKVKRSFPDHIYDMTL